MDDIKFSVVLPVYNVADYLRECLDSLINQTYSNLEIICVNDGSTDNSLAILQEYAAKDSRIKVFDRVNSGSGISRTFGISQSSGDYLSFIDPDDWVELDMYEKLCEFIMIHNSVVVEFAYKQYFEVENIFVHGKHVKAIQKNCKVDLSAIDQYSWKDFSNVLLKYQSPCWNKVYLRKFILDNHIEFSDHPTGQDIAFLHGVLFFVDKIDLLHQEFYIYRKRQGSAIASTKKRNLIYLFDQIDRTEKTLKRAGVFDCLKKDFQAYKMRLVYDADKKCANEYRKIINEKAKEYLTSFEYIQFLFKKTINRMLRNLFNIKKRYGGTNKTQITILGFTFQI